MARTLLLNAIEEMPTRQDRQRIARKVMFGVALLLMVASFALIAR